MWLLTCASNDESAMWAWDGLKRRGLEPFEVLSPVALACETGWQHRIEDCRVSTEITLPNGRRVSDREISGVLNRLSIIDQTSLIQVQQSDRYYVTHELQGFLLSWLHGLAAPVINRPTPLGLSGRLRHVSEWIWLASKAGLPNRKYRQSSQDSPLQWDVSVRLADAGVPVVSFVVLEGSVIQPDFPSRGEVPNHIKQGCARLCELSGAALLGMDFEIAADGAWLFAGVSTSPDLRLGGEPLLDALASTLGGGVRERE